MFWTLIYPSSGACDYSVELPHWSYCSWFEASACNTDTTPTQPHRNSNTHRTKNNTTNVVIQQNSRKLLMIDILMPETCWAHKKWNKIASDVKLVFYSSIFHLCISLALPLYLSFSPFPLLILRDFLSLQFFFAYFLSPPFFRDFLSLLLALFCFVLHVPLIETSQWNRSKLPVVTNTVTKLYLSCEQRRSLQMPPGICNNSLFNDAVPYRIFCRVAVPAWHMGDELERILCYFWIF